MIKFRSQSLDDRIFVRKGKRRKTDVGATGWSPLDLKAWHVREQKEFSSILG